jgi:sec-independent protein translocase protein TatA
MLNNIGSTELIIIMLVLMILFGTKKIPEFARGIGEASKEFKKGLHGEPETKKTTKKTNKEETA